MSKVFRPVVEIKYAIGIFSNEPHDALFAKERIEIHPDTLVHAKCDTPGSVLFTGSAPFLLGCKGCHDHDDCFLVINATKKPICFQPGQQITFSA